VNTVDKDPIYEHVELAPIEDDPIGGVLFCRVQPPPTRVPQRVDQLAGPVTGHRVIWQSQQGWHFDIRATSEPYVSPDDGELLINVVAEVDWYRSKLTGAPLRERAAYAEVVFLERPADTSGANP